MFFSRITSKGLLDTTHGDLSGNSKTGATLFTATSGTIQDGGWFSFDSGSAAAIMWIEQDGATRRLVIERVPAVDDLEFDPKILAAGVSADDLVGFELGYSLHADKLYRNLGIARHLLELRKSLDADPSVHLTTNVKSSAVTLFNQAIKSALTAKINRASNNSARSTHSMRHKKGAMNKEIAKLIYSTANFTNNQQTALSTHISNRMNLIFDYLKNQRYKVTGKKVKTKKVPA